MIELAATQVSPFVAILAALLSGGLIGTVWQIYMGKKRGPSEMQDIVTRVSNQVMAGAQDLLNEYRIQLEVSQRQIETYLSQLSDLNRLLGEANARIARLEAELQKSHIDRDGLHQELEQIRRQRDMLSDEVNKLRSRIDQIRSEMEGAK